jgi:hypothetical protein
MRTSRASRQAGFAPSFAIPVATCVLLASGTVWADAPASTPAPAARPAPGNNAASGLAVVAIDATSDLAWPLAQEIYRRPAIRPAALDEARARVLAGEAPTADASQSLRDLAETRAAIRGNDAPSRQLLASIANTLHVRALVVVSVEEADASVRAPIARVFMADTGAFDAARYAPDDAPGSAVPVWSGAGQSLERMYSAPAVTPLGSAGAVGPARATIGAPAAVNTSASATNKAGGEGSSKPFYVSPWFWGAIGAAALGGVVVFAATRDNNPDTIHLQMQVPK